MKIPKGLQSQIQIREIQTFWTFSLFGTNKARQKNFKRDKIEKKKKKRNILLIILILFLLFAFASVSSATNISLLSFEISALDSESKPTKFKHQSGKIPNIDLNLVKIKGLHTCLFIDLCCDIFIFTVSSKLLKSWKPSLFFLSKI